MWLTNLRPLVENACCCCFFNLEMSRCHFAREAVEALDEHKSKGKGKGKGKGRAVTPPPEEMEQMFDRMDLGVKLEDEDEEMTTYNPKAENY